MDFSPPDSAAIANSSIYALQQQEADLKSRVAALEKRVEMLNQAVIVLCDALSPQPKKAAVRPLSE